MARPRSMTGLRPKRSASGPTTSGAAEKPARKIAIIVAAFAWVVCRSSSTRARLGKAMSIDNGGRAESEAKKRVKPNPWALMRIVTPTKTQTSTFRVFSARRSGPARLPRGSQLDKRARRLDPAHRSPAFTCRAGHSNRNPIFAPAAPVDGIEGLGASGTGSPRSRRGRIRRNRRTRGWPGGLAGRCLSLAITLTPPAALPDSPWTRNRASLPPRGTGWRAKPESRPMSPLVSRAGAERVPGRLKLVARGGARPSACPASRPA